MTPFVAALARHRARTTLAVGALSWQDLGRAVDERAKELLAGGERVLVVEQPRGATWVVELLAAHTVGAAFVPLDPSAPAIYRSALRERIAAAPAEVLTGLAWVVFTSGSTGRPKGVCVGFGGVEGLLRGQVSAFEMGPESRVLWALSPGFDASFSDVGTALYAGGSLVPYPGATSDFPALLAFLHTHGITHADLPPALLAHIDPEALPRSLQTIIVGGEPCPPHALRAHARRRRVVNVYGPTEATVCTSLEVVSATAPRASTSIGRPLEGVHYACSDGELVIAGPAVARGYLDDDALTAARFAADGYRTGDRVCQEEDGTWTFLGRLDRQVKIAGKLVAPEELEACLRATDGVRSAVARLVDGRLVANIDASCTDDALHASYKHLPTYLHPSRIVRGAATVSERGKTQGILKDLPTVVAAVLGRVVDAEEPLGLDSLRRIELVAAIEGELGICLPSDALSDVGTLRDLDRVVAARKPDAGAALAELLARFPAPPMAPQEPRPALRNRRPVLQTAPVFLTGGTGLLGAHLARALGRAGVPLRVLMRAPACPPGSAEAEARARLDRLGIVATPVLGDLADHALLAAEAGAASVVVHLAASLRLDANIDALYPENVAPLAPLLASGTRLVVASSLAVLAFSNAASRKFAGPLDPTQSVEDAHIFGGYAQSKALLEAWCAGHPQAHLLRIGLVVADGADGADGVAPSGRCPLRALIAALRLLERRPAAEFLGAAFDAVPLGAVVEALVACVHEPGAAPKAVYAATPATLEDLYAAFEAAGRPLASVPAEDFREAVYRSPLLPLERRVALELLRHSRPPSTDLAETAANLGNNVLFRLGDRRFDPAGGAPGDPRATLLPLVLGAP